jgi:hypothetical protein
MRLEAVRSRSDSLETLYTALFYWARYVEQIGVPVAVSVLYFILMKPQPLVSRVLASVHGLMFILALGFVRVLGGPGENRTWTRVVFFLLVGLGVASVGFSMWGRKVRPVTHLAQVLNLSHAMIIVYLGLLTFDPE